MVFLRAKTLNLLVSTAAGVVAQAPGFFLKSPVAHTKVSGNADIALSSGGAFSSAAGVADGVTETIAATATGADGVVIPYTANLTGQAAVTAPAAPTLSVVSTGDGTVTLGWTDGSNGGSAITQRLLFTGTSSGGEGAGVPVTVSGGQVVLTGLTNGTALYFEGACVNAIGTSALSGEVSATPNPASAGANDILLLIYGQSLVGNQGSAGLTPLQAHYDLAADANVRIFDTPIATSTSGAAWDAYRASRNSNPVQGRSAVTISAATWLSGVLTVTTSASHGYGTSPGDVQTITHYGNTPSAINGVFTATRVDATHYTIPLASDPGALTVGGSTQKQHFWGREAQLIELLRAKNPGCRIDIVKYGPGGAQLNDDNTGPAVLLPGGTIGGTQHWTPFKNTVNAAKSAGLNVRTGYKTVFLFDQGPTDAQNSTKAAAYQANLATLWAAAQTDLGATQWIVSQLFGTTTGNPSSLTSTYAQCDTVRAAQAAAVTTAGAAATLVDDAPAWTTANGSTIHYPPSSMDGTNGTASRTFSVFFAPVKVSGGTVAGSPQVGQTLTYTPIVYDYTPYVAPTYKWQRSADGSTGWADISGATGATYVPVSGDLTYCLRPVESAGGAGSGTITVTNGPVSAAVTASAYDSTATALFAAMTTQLNSTQKQAISDWIAAEKTAGRWAKLKKFHAFHMPDAQQAKLEWVSQAQTVVFNGGVTFGGLTGPALDGTTGYLDLGYTEASYGTLNSEGFGIWPSSGTSTTDMIGTSTGGQRISLNRSTAVTGNVHSPGVSIIGAGSSPPARATHHSIRRTASTGFDYFNAGGRKTSITTASASLQAGNIWLGKNGSSFTNDNFMFFYAFDGTWSDTDVANFDTSLAGLVTNMGM